MSARLLLSLLLALSACSSPAVWQCYEDPVERDELARVTCGSELVLIEADDWVLPFGARAVDLRPGAHRLLVGPRADAHLVFRPTTAAGVRVIDAELWAGRSYVVRAAEHATWIEQRGSAEPVAIAREASAAERRALRWRIALVQAVVAGVPTDSHLAAQH